jgi:hypothetical protein
MMVSVRLHDLCAVESPPPVILDNKVLQYSFLLIMNDNTLYSNAQAIVFVIAKILSNGGGFQRGCNIVYRSGT